MTRPANTHPTRFDYCVAELIRLAVVCGFFLTMFHILALVPPERFPNG